MARLVEPASALHASAETCSCWMWSDPHVERCDGTYARFDGSLDQSPIFTFASWPKGFVQSYHCPISKCPRQETPKREGHGGRSSASSAAGTSRSSDASTSNTQTLTVTISLSPRGAMLG